MYYQVWQGQLQFERHPVETENSEPDAICLTPLAGSHRRTLANVISISAICHLVQHRPTQDYRIAYTRLFHFATFFKFVANARVIVPITFKINSVKNILKKINYNTRAEATSEKNAQKLHFFPNNSGVFFFFFKSTLDTLQSTLYFNFC
jgi:hypothetical protein